MGGFPGEKKRSLTFGALLSIADNNAIVESGARAGALAVPAAGTDSSIVALVAVVTCSTILLQPISRLSEQQDGRESDSYQGDADRPKTGTSDGTP